MTIRHHLSEPILIAYAAGSLPEAFGLVVATHVSLCDECRARLETYETLGGAVLENAAPAPVAPGSLEAALRSIRDRGKAPIVAPLPPRGGLFPAPLRDYAGGDVAAVRWRAVGGGVRQAILPAAGAASVRLLCIPAGQSVPDHGHGGMELTLVLQGAFRDAGERFGRGDVEIATEETHHTPVAEPGADCICLTATDAPLRFKGLIPRMAQSFLRI